MKIESLGTARDFQRVFSHGRRRRSGDLQVVAAPRPAPDLPTRLGLAVKADGAVARNRIKRRLRAAFRASAPPRGWDVVVSAGPPTASTDFQGLEESLSGLLQDAGR